jgi:hypothetical protein
MVIPGVRGPVRHSIRPLQFIAAALLVVLPLPLHAQRGRGAQAAAPVTAKATAPIDLTGYWVSLVTEDWRWRMVTPAKGDYPSIPLNEAGRRFADGWDPAKDEAEGNQCRSYGAGNITRQPGRLHITWEDDDTLRVDTDAGTQTRLFHFGDWKSPGGEPTWQGDSAAQWELAGSGRGARGQAAQSRGGDLKVTTTRMRPGYLQKNGVPYSGNAVVTEYFHRTIEDNGDSWLIVTTIVDDRQYLTGQFARSSHFKKLPDASGWDPKPCTAR